MVKQRVKFKYNDKGTLATIGKAKAVGVVKGFKIIRIYSMARMVL